MLIRTKAIAAAAVLGLGAPALGTARLVAQGVTGTVSSEGRPLVGAQVRLLGLDRVERTGAQGHFRFDDLPPGTYRLFVSLIGYASATDSVRVGRRSPSST